MPKRKAYQVQADKKYDEKSPLIAFRLPVEYSEKVEQMAVAEGITKAEMFRRLIINSLP